MNCPNCEIEKQVHDIDAEVQRNNEEIQKLAARNSIQPYSDAWEDYWRTAN